MGGFLFSFEKSTNSTHISALTLKIIILFENYMLEYLFKKSFKLILQRMKENYNVTNLSLFSPVKVISLHKMMPKLHNF